ncbi:MAG: sirohydrochlorin cobaltochelatase [Bilophila wadsworthia]
MLTSGSPPSKAPTASTTSAQAQASGAKRVWLSPSIVAGDHANNDLAGPEEDSWASASRLPG